ncbi:MAG: hypothetical protein V4466_04505 [Pseudomonadota bacterium]
MTVGKKHILSAVIGGGVAGPLDLLAATTQFNAPFDVICKSVAAGWIGRDAAMAGGLPMVLLGFFSDLAISIGAALVYVTASSARDIQRPWINGTLFGLAMFTVMRFIVTPLSAAPRGAMPPQALAESLLVHAFLFGLPVALIAAWILKPRQEALA